MASSQCHLSEESHISWGSMLNRFTGIPFCATLYTAARQAPLSTGFSRQEYWVGCCALLQGIFPTQRLNGHLLRLLHWQAGSLPLAPCGKAYLGILREFNHWVRAACGRHGLGPNLGMTFRAPHLGPSVNYAPCN